jgi:acetylornithine/N-succinyldiaminopimelate aminotransferase
VFRAKRDQLLAFFRSHGLEAQGSEATLYLWVKVPGGRSAAAYASRLLDEGIVVSPGNAFGPAGEGFVRVSLVPTRQDIEEAIERWRTVRS